MALAMGAVRMLVALPWAAGARLPPGCLCQSSLWLWGPARLAVATRDVTAGLVWWGTCRASHGQGIGEATVCGGESVAGG